MIGSRIHRNDISDSVCAVGEIVAVYVRSRGAGHIDAELIRIDFGFNILVDIDRKRTNNDYTRQRDYQEKRYKKACKYLKELANSTKTDDTRRLQLFSPIDFFTCHIFSPFSYERLLIPYYHTFLNIL